MEEKNMTPQDYLKQISMQDFMHMGVDQIAYVKPVLGPNGDETEFAIHAADGRQISVMDSYPTAVAVIQQNDLMPVTIQ